MGVVGRAEGGGGTGERRGEAGRKSLLSFAKVQALQAGDERSTLLALSLSWMAPALCTVVPCRWLINPPDHQCFPSLPERIAIAWGEILTADS